MPSGVPAAGKTAVYFLDTVGTLADIYFDNGTPSPGAPAPGATLTMDGNGQQPNFWGPASGQDYLYTRVNGGPLMRVDADYNPRIDTLQATKQATDPDLTALAALTPTDGDLIQRLAGAWTNRTGPQVKTALGLDQVDNATVAGKVTKDTLVVNVRDHGAAGDGTTDDTTAVQAAAALIAAAGGGTVYFPPGHYATTGIVLQNMSWFTVRGDRGAVLTLLPNTVGAPNRASANVVTVVSCTDFTLVGLHVDGRRDTIAPLAVLTQNASAGQPQVKIGHGVSATFQVGQHLNLCGGLTAAAGADVDKEDKLLTVQTLTVGAGSGDDTVTFTTNLGSSYTAAAGTVSDGYGPIAGAGAYVTPWQTGDTTIAGRHLTEEDQQQGIHLIACARFAVTGCTVHGMWESGIRCGTHLLAGQAQTDGCSYGRVAGNSIFHCYDQGVGVWCSHDMAVVDNVCDATGWAGICLTLSDDSTAVGNVSVNQAQRIPSDAKAGYGLAVEGGYRNTITANKVRNSFGAGIYLTAGGTIPFGGPAQVATTVAAGSDTAALPAGTISVVATTGMATAGQATVLSSAGAQQITYTGKTGTTLTGCTGGVGTLFTGQKVTQYPVFLTNGAALQIGALSTVVSDGTLFQAGGRYSIVDGPRTERIVVAAVAGTTVTLAQPTTFRHPDRCQIGQVVCEANIIVGNAVADSGDAGIKLSSAVRTSVFGNSIDRSGLRGIDLAIWVSGGLQAPHGTLIVGNTITAPDTTADGAAYQGIAVQQTSDVAIIGNRVGGALSTSGSVSALMVQGCTDVLVDRNVLADVYNVGIRVDSFQNWQSRRVSVTGNTVTRCFGEGIILFGGIGLNVSGNTISSCAANNGPGGFGGALNVRGVSYSQIGDNTVYNNGHGGISLDTATINAVVVATANNVFARNVCYDDGANIDPYTGATTQQGHGIKEVSAGNGPNTYDSNTTVGNITDFSLSSAGNTFVVNSARKVQAGVGLTGGGDLTADRTLTVAYGTTGTTAAVGNDARITGALQAAGNLAAVANAATALANLGGLPIVSPTATGDVVFQKADASKGYRFRTSGTNLDNEAAGADWFVSVWSGAGFTGSQRTYLRLEAGVQLLHLAGKVVIDTGVFGGGVITLDPAAGIGFYGTAAAAKQTVTGSKGANAALGSLLTALANYGLITDTST